MKQTLSICLLSCLSIAATYAQKRIYVPIDEVYEAYINASYIGAYNGKPPQGSITIKNVNTGKELLKLEVESFYDDSFLESADKTLSIDEQDWILMDDYNFDGINDIAVTNGQINYDDTFQYQVYLGTKDGKLIFSPEFTEIISQGGMLTVDSQKKQLRFEYDNDEDDNIDVETYKVVNNKPVLITN